MSKRIFSGKSSQKFWDAVNKSKDDILYDYGCKAQKLEAINADLLTRFEKAIELLEKASMRYFKNEDGVDNLIAQAIDLLNQLS